MNKSQKLYQISKDIEILENAGKIKAAEVLHQKFIKEAQYAMPQMMPMMMPQMMMPQMMPQMMPMMMARPTVAPAAVARPAVAPAAAARPVTTPAPVQQGQVTQPTPQPAPAPSPAPTPPPTNKEIKPPYTGTTPPPNPLDNTQRGYGNQQSKDQEMQYLMNEKKRLEEMGANDPSSPYYRQYQTILEMIKRNQGGSIIKKSKNMNKLQKLAQLNKDIELLEAAGKFKAAEVLQKKFVKEAQAQGAFGGIVTQDAKNFMMELDKAYNSGQPTLGVIQKAERAGLPPQELQALKNHAAKIRTQANTDFNSQYPSSGYSTPQQNTGYQTPQQNTEPAAPNGELSDQVKAEQADIVMKGYGDALESGKNNMNIPAKYRMTSQENEAENQLYSSTINEIKKLLATGNETQRNYAKGLYQNTRQKFKNLKRQYLFDQQYAAIERNPNKNQ